MTADLYYEVLGAYYDAYGAQAGEIYGALLRDIAQAHSVTIAQVAIAASLSRKGVTSAIVGTQNPHHFLDNLAAADLVLQDDELSAIWETSDRVLRDLES